MKFPMFYVYKYTINDLKNSSALEKINLNEGRRKTNILMVDDDDPIVMLYLNRLGYHIIHEKDIKVTDASDYDIILCDIQGVGQQYKAPGQGAFLVEQIKRRYPSKVVIAYSSHPQDFRFFDHLKYADDVISKGDTPDMWVPKLDAIIDEMYDPISRWYYLRDKLLACGVETAMVAKYEDRYVSSCIKKNFKGLSDLRNDNNSDAQRIIADFLCSKIVKYVMKGL